MSSDDSKHDEPTDVPDIGIAQALRTLPLCDELYLGMQAMNIEIVDGFLDHQEAHLLSEYMEKERTPTMTALYVSAFSQMWVFAVYEFLRTWRQRARAIVRWAKELQRLPDEERSDRVIAKQQEIRSRAAEPRGAAVFYWPAYEEAAKAPQFVDSLRKAVDRTERLFRRIEALRMSLAKHEMLGVRGSYAMAPGYGRIDMLTGSIYWQVALRDNQVDIVSRRAIADDCRRLALNRDVLILPEPAREAMKNIPDDSYGIKRVRVALDDGTAHGGVYVSWSKEVLLVERTEIGSRSTSRGSFEVEHDPAIASVRITRTWSGPGPSGLARVRLPGSPAAHMHRRYAARLRR